MLKSLFFLTLVGCAGASVEVPAGSEADVAAASLAGDLHLQSRTLDEEFAFDGAVTELSITKNGADCKYQALLAVGGCNAAELCSTTEMLSTDQGKKINGTCTIAGTVLTLDAAANGLQLRAKAYTANGDEGFVLSSVDGKPLNKGGSSAFFARTSRNPGDAFYRSYRGGTLPALTKPIEPNDTSLPEAVRAELGKAIAELSFTEAELHSEVDETFAVFATPFDDKPVAYGVAAHHSGDHCGGFQVFGVDAASGARLKEQMSDGDCGL
jgi:hypothetical protein